MNDYPPTEHGDWERARGHMSGTVPLRTLEQARADIHKSNVREIVATYGLLTIAEVQALLKNRRISTRYGYLTADEILAEVRSRGGCKMTKLSSTKLAPCVCGNMPSVPSRKWSWDYWHVMCAICTNQVKHRSVRGARELWNAAMLGLSMEEKEK